MKERIYEREGFVHELPSNDDFYYLLMFNIICMGEFNEGRKRVS